MANETSFKKLFHLALGFLRSVGINIRPANQLVSNDRKRRATHMIKRSVVAHAYGVSALHKRHQYAAMHALHAKARKVDKGQANHKWKHPNTPTFEEIVEFQQSM